ncbi:MAG: LacI family DNA-binding transcriptional regulator [Bacillota bacterium]
MVTIKDIARLANVSPSTVSRVIADSKRISAETKKRVKKIMAELNYHPNMIARSLITRSCQTLGLVLSRSAESAFSNPFFPEVIRGISTITQKYHYNLMLATAEDYAEEARQALRMVAEKRVDGVILLASRVNDELIRQLTAHNYPFVVVGRIPETIRCYSVNNDNIQAAYSAVRHLLNHGHQRIALVNGPEEYIFCQDRAEGYRFALREFGIEYDPSLIKNGPLTQEDGYRLTGELLNTRPCPSAIFCVDDLMAVGAYRAIKENHLSIPRDIAVIGFNDDPIASVMEPNLTTTRIPIYEMGISAAEILLQILEGKEIFPMQKILSSELIVRQSCGTKQEN